MGGEIGRYANRLIHPGFRRADRGGTEFGRDPPIERFTKTLFLAIHSLIFTLPGEKTTAEIIPPSNLGEGIAGNVNLLCTF